jgi:hypothetical protein
MINDRSEELRKKSWEEKKPSRARFPSCDRGQSSGGGTVRGGDTCPDQRDESEPKERK